MHRIFRSFAIIGIAMVTSSSAWSETLPVFPLDHVVLEAHLIIEGRRIVDSNSIRVMSVLFGQAEPGDAIQVDGLEKLPMNAHRDYRSFETEEEDGDPIGDTVGVFFLVQEHGQNTASPVGLGSGVKWLLNDGVFGYIQPENPGPYFLMRDREVKTIAAFYASIAANLQKRQSFSAAMAEPDIRTRSQRLAAFIATNQPRHYFDKATKALSALGHQGALVLQREAVNPEQKDNRNELLAAIGRSQDNESVAFLAEVIKQAQPLLQNAASPFIWSGVSAQQKAVMLD